MSEDQRPPDETTHAAGDKPNDESTGKRLGDFELLRELGRGGMGIVYEARQLSLNRRVALKVLPPALGLTGQATQRFEREAKAAAKLHHTNIVPVHAIGEQDGHHFYAMDLIEGQSLDHVLHELIDEGSSPLMEATVTQTLAAIRPQPATSSQEQVETSLSDTSAGGREWFDTVAKLMSEVADGLHYAHGRGVIHRDIKPANLMLSKEGHLCVTDFGLARITQEPGMTVSGSFLGTPAYMSPEQIAAGRMKLDHRTDIYSLGTVLYELLALQRPFPGESREEVLGAILTKDPPPLRRFNKRIPVDLETICLKALEKDPDRRYQSAGELAQDLRQHLQGGVIAARRAGPVRRTWKSIRRHPVAATAVGVSLLALGIIVGVSWVLSSQRAEETARRAVADARFHFVQGEYSEGLAKAEEALEIAPDLGEGHIVRAKLLMELSRHDEAIEAAKAMLARDPDDWMAHLILARLGRGGRRQDIAAEDHLAAMERLAPETADAYYLRALMAERAAEAIELLNRALEIDPAHNWALESRSDRYCELRDYGAARADAERMVAIRPRSSKGRRQLAYVAWKQQDYQRALIEIDRALELDPDDTHAMNLRSRVHESMREIEKAIADLTRAIELTPGSHLLRRRARGYNHLGRHEEALADARRGVEQNPEDFWVYYPLIEALIRLEGHEEVHETLDRLRTVSAEWTDMEARARVHAYLSRFYRRLEQHDRALEEATRAIDLDPGEAWHYVARIQARRLLGDHGGVEADCDALASLEPEDPGGLLNRAKYVGRNCKRWEDMLEHLDPVIERYPSWADPHFERGTALYFLKRYDGSLSDLTRAIELNPYHTAAYNNRAVVLGRLSRYEEQIADLEKSLELNPRNISAINNVADQRAMRFGQYEEALRELDRVFELDPQYAFGYFHRATLLNNLGRFAEAAVAAERGIELDPTLHRAYYQLARAHLSLGSSEKARSTLERLMAAAAGWRREDAAWAHAVAADQYRFLGALDEGLAAADRAIEIDPDCYLGFVARARAQIARGDMRRWRADCEAAAAIELETSSELLYRNGYLGKDCDRWDLALRDVAKAIDLDPDAPDALVVRASIRLDLGQLDLARADLDRAIEIEPTSRFAHADRGLHAAMIGDCEAATASLDRALELAGQDANIWASIAWVHVALMVSQCPEQYDGEAALDLVRRAVATFPLEEGYRSALGLALYRSDRFEEATAAFEKALESRVRADATDLFPLAMAQAKLGDATSARDTYRRAVARMQPTPASPVCIQLRREAAEVLGVQ